MKDQVLRQNGKCHKGYFSVSCLSAAFFATLMATVKKEDLKYITMEQSHKTTQAKLRITQLERLYTHDCPSLSVLENSLKLLGRPSNTANKRASQKAIREFI